MIQNYDNEFNIDSTEYQSPIIQEHHQEKVKIFEFWQGQWLREALIT